jgi:streptogramin lyase
MKLRFALLLSLASIMACAKASPSEFIDPDATTPPPPVDAGPQNSFGEAGTGLDFTGECAEETKQIYVLGTDKALYRFNPATLQFKHLGVIACPSSAGTFSMAIDRRGTAWVEFTDGRLFAVSTFDASCKPTAFQAGQTGFTTFGMGYAKNADGSGETLYASGAGLAALDTKTFELKFLGSLSFGRTELTGLDQELYAFAVGSGVVARLNKQTAATEVVYRTTAINETAAFAFAQWGGEFWIFTGNEMSKVTRYQPSTDTSTIAVENTGMLIVGAGSSTCAPTKPVL